MSDTDPSVLALLSLAGAEFVGVLEAQARREGLLEQSKLLLEGRQIVAEHSDRINVLAGEYRQLSDDLHELQRQALSLAGRFEAVITGLQQADAAYAEAIGRNLAELQQIQDRLTRFSRGGYYHA